MSICYARPQIYFGYCQQKLSLMKQKRELYKLLLHTTEKDLHPNHVTFQRDLITSPLFLPYQKVRGKSKLASCHDGAEITRSPSHH